MEKQVRNSAIRRLKRRAIITTETTTNWRNTVSTARAATPKFSKYCLQGERIKALGYEHAKTGRKRRKKGHMRQRCTERDDSQNRKLSKRFTTKPKRVEKFARSSKYKVTLCDLFFWKHHSDQMGGRRKIPLRRRLKKLY